MVGLRTQEDSKFLNFWEIVQKSANSIGKVFFLDCGEGNCFEDNNIECENLTGWLIDIQKANEFEKVFNSDEHINDKWSDFLAFASWKKDSKNNIKVTFEML